DLIVTGVQTCALPISVAAALETAAKGSAELTGGAGRIAPARPRALARRRRRELARHGFAERARRLLCRRLGRRGSGGRPGHVDEIGRASCRERVRGWV